MHHHKATAAEIARTRQSHRKSKSNSYSRIDGIASFLQNSDTNMCR